MPCLCRPCLSLSRPLSTHHLVVGSGSAGTSEEGRGKRKRWARGLEMVVSAKTSDPLALDLWPPTRTSAARSFSLPGDPDAEAGVAGDVPGLPKREAVEEYVRGLEEERSKVEWFQRELPLCMLILTHVIEGLKGELARRGGGDATGMEKKPEDEGEEVKRRKDRPEEPSRLTSSWMWSSPKCGANASIRDDGGKMAGEVGTDEPLSLLSPRKARRSWSPELHRRFVSAVEQLGGSQAATPKQIRQLMKVDGLTNDEVKSHLQKYRLHRQRLPAVSSSPADRQHLVLWEGVMQVTKNPRPVGKQRISHDSGSPAAWQRH